MVVPISCVIEKAILCRVFFEPPLASTQYTVRPASFVIDVARVVSLAISATQRKLHSSSLPRKANGDRPRTHVAPVQDAVQAGVRQPSLHVTPRKHHTAVRPSDAPCRSPADPSRASCGCGSHTTRGVPHPPTYLPYTCSVLSKRAARARRAPLAPGSWGLAGAQGRFLLG